MEKLVLKESYRKSKPDYEQKRSYKHRKKKEEKFDLDNEFVMRSGEIPHIKVSKQVGYYKVGKSFHIFFERKPNLIHRFFTKILLGWKWHDQK